MRMFGANAASPFEQPCVESYVSKPDADTLRRIIEEIEPGPQGGNLAITLSAYFPSYQWAVSALDITLNQERIVSRNGHILSADPDGWLETTISRCGGDYQAAWREIRAQGLKRVRAISTPIFAFTHLGGGPANWMQIRFEQQQDMTVAPLVSDRKPETEYDLRAPDVRERTADDSRPRYVFGAHSGVVDVGEWMGEQGLSVGSKHAGTHPAVRWFEDWEQSTAGNVEIFRFWAADLPQENFQPFPLFAPPVAWIDATGLGAEALAREITQFDMAAGYTMAWFFHMVNGNLSSAVGRAVHDLHEKNKRLLQPRDAAVLRRWMQRPYRL